MGNMQKTQKELQEVAENRRAGHEIICSSGKSKAAKDE